MPDLPPITRWTPRAKRNLVESVERGDVSLDEVCRHYVRATAYRNGLTVPGLNDGARGPSPSIYALGNAARAAGLTIADIERIAETRRVHAVAMAQEAE